jgi:hypothetical protein
MTNESDPNGSNLRRELVRQMLAARPEALAEAVQILNAHRDEVVAIITRYAYTDPLRLGGYLDRDLPRGVTASTAGGGGPRRPPAGLAWRPGR